MRLRLITALAAASLLAACASAPRPAEGWLSGRLNLRVDATASQTAQAHSALFELRGGSDDGELLLSTPLGGRLASARWAGNGAWLDRGDGERAYPSLDALSLDVLGQPLPLAALPDWLAGRPWPAAPHRATDLGFEQLGWAVDTSRLDQQVVEARREQPPPALWLRVRLQEAAP